MMQLVTKCKQLPFSLKCAIVFLCIIVMASAIAFPFDTFMLLAIIGTVVSFIRIITYMVEGK